jgi:hypothetical protein
MRRTPDGCSSRWHHVRIGHVSQDCAPRAPKQPSATSRPVVSKMLTRSLHRLDLRPGGTKGKHRVGHSNHVYWQKTHIYKESA